jgi:hypothetical protein
MSAVTTGVSDPGTLDLPEEWIEIAPSGEDRSSWIDATVAELGFESAAELRFRHGVTMAAGVADSLRPENRHNFIMLDTAKAGIVRGLLSVQMLRVGPTAWDDYNQFHSTASALTDVEFINRRVEERALHAGRALVIHEFSLRDQDGADAAYPAMERAIVGLFVRDSEAFVELTIITQDLALFPDMLEYLVDIANTYVRKAGAPQ